MTDVARDVERGVLRAVGKLVLIVVLLGALVALGIGIYHSSEGYQDRKAQEEMLDRMQGR